ncbi:hypothetical protein PPOLYM_03568 [Paenibacillus polymyxa]|jgi:hypothetical protein|uniref:Uncharacterized protein n=1 Tax=Paenibacillus peoriae TaxID=59893 RepID=A0ABU1QKS3_9BACL|nr:hypothetical protein PPE_05075 [Paenibacillus polymyxa E681]MBP1174297.1 hypothetical protein [Paenibacillus sp. PvR133]MBP1309342.1 hypothetical protein [Paenibacillus sp. 1182]MDQ0049067.1 hypothetical protein [Paenibacillus polymyxa]MDR6780231.1 hypothetical protein [Paenibacillus peoriae]QYK60128.1 hypothetical protein KAI37_00437 [Paenibacillus sp. S25]SFR19153.1 hypothetical protein SAMN04488603_10544 [Paenibacillus sp. cl130]
MKNLKYSRVIINAIIVASVIIALTSGYKIGG